MIKRGIKIVFGTVFSLFVASHSNSAQAAETITWVQNDLIPFFIKDGPYKGQGISDKLTTFFKEKLPQYHHVIEDMSFSRFYALAERGDTVCNALLLKTPERQKILHYSLPFKPAYTHVIVSDHHAHHGVVKGAVNLTEYFAHPDHTLIVQKNRSYGEALDAQIQKLHEAGRIKRHNFSTRQLMTMMENERIHHFIDVESAVTYFAALNIQNKNIHAIPLKDSRLDKFGYTACSKTATGQKIMDDINHVIRQEAASTEFRDILESWLAEKNKARFRKFYEDRVLSNLN